MKTQKEAVNWITQQEGKWLDWPNSGSGAQCVDIVAYYLKYLGKSWPGANAAKDLWDRDLGSEYTKEKDPQPGDIAVWSGKVGRGYGHTALVLRVLASGPSGHFESMDQNYKNFNLEQGSPGAKILHDRANILGFIRPRFLPDVPAPQPPAPASAAAAGPSVHVIVAGDTFWGLEQKYNWPHGTLQKLNPVTDPRALKIGSAINIPGAAPVNPTPNSSGKKYAIQPGESFWSIEERNNWPHGTLQKLNPTLDPRAIPKYYEINIPN